MRGRGRRHRLWKAKASAPPARGRMAIAPFSVALPFLLLPLSLAARTPDTTVLSLSEALDLAAVHNPAYRQALNQVELGEAARRQAWGSFLPSLDVGASTATGFSRRTITEDVFGNPVENPNTRTAWSSSTAQSVSLGLTLFEGGRRFRELSRTRAEADAEAEAAEARLLTVRADVERQFYETQRQQELLAVEREILEGRRTDLDATRRMFELASLSRADVLGAEVEVQRQEQAIQQVEGAYRKALLALRTAVGAADVLALRVEPAPVTVFDPAFLDGAALIERARSTNPAVREQEARARARRAQAEVARAGRWPTIRVSGSLSRSAFGADQQALFDPGDGDQTGGSVGLSVSLPLLDRFGTSYAITQAEIGHENARETLRETGLQLEEDVRSRLIDLETAWVGLRLAESARELADERLRLARESYRLAGLTFEELQSAVRSAADARRQAVEARFGFVQARIELEAVVGTPVTPEGA